MKRFVKYFTLLTALVTLFAALGVTTCAYDSTEPDLSFVFLPETQLAVYVDDEWDPALSDNFGYGESVSLTAPATSGDKSFAYWEADGSIVSYSNPLTLTMNANTTLFAVYAASAPEAEPVAGFTSITRTTDGKQIVLQAKTSGEAAGFVYSTTATGDKLKIDGEGVTNVEAVKLSDDITAIPQSALDRNNCYSLKITPGSSDTVYHVRAYVTTESEPAYGEVKDVKLSDLEAGVSMVANLEGFWPGTDEELAKLTNGMLTVTYDANGGVGATIIQSFLGNSVTLRLNSFTREGYIFGGWNTAADGKGTSYADAASVTLSESTTLYAQWKVKSSSSGGSTTTTVTVPVTSDATPGTVPVKASVSGTTATVTKLTDEQLAQVTTNKSGNKDADAETETNSVVIDVSGVAKDIKTATIPTETVKAVEETGSNLKVTLTDGSVEFDATAQATITDEAKGATIQVNLDAVKVTTLTSAQQSAVESLEVEVVLDAYVTSNGQRISDFKGGSATLSVPYTLKNGQDAQGIVVWYVASDGTRTQVDASYDGKNVVFSVPHFSNYVIAYDAEKAAACPQDTTCPISAFTDAKPTAWYHDGVHWALENGVMNGVGDGKFAPNDTTTRAQVVTMLWRLEGSPAYVGMSEFSDVDNEEWYGPAIRWASAEGIVNGYDGKFAPNDPVTREQLVTILYRYAQYKKMDVSVGEDTNILSYDDAFDVHEWAMAAMQWACGSGIVNGIGTNLEPAGDASRAQVATMLWRFCK